MANGYITYNGKRYRLTPRSFAEQPKVARQTKTSLSGKTLTQTFSFTDTRWKVEIWVAINSNETPTYGELADLRTAYALAYASFTDVFGTVHSVVPEGDLALPFDIGLKNDDAPFKVTLNLRKRNT